MASAKDLIELDEIGVFSSPLMVMSESLLSYSLIFVKLFKIWRDLYDYDFNFNFLSETL